MAQMAKIRILIIDDTEIVRNGYEILFAQSSKIEICGKAASGDEGLALYDELKPDVVLMDILMPGKDGLRTCRELLFKYDDAQVILNTAHVKEDAVNSLMRSGAQGILLKDA